MLELAVLGLLKEEAMHGYELKKQLGQKLGHFWQVSFGSLYPTLKRLEKRGAVETVFSGDRTSRRRNVYRITPQGEKEFLELIEDRAHTAWEEDKFPLRLAFFRYVKPDVRIRLLERRKVYLQEKLADLRHSLDDAAEPIDSYTMSLLKHGMDATEADIAWLEELIDTERTEVARAADVAAEDHDDAPSQPPADEPTGTETSTTTTRGATARP